MLLSELLTKLTCGDLEGEELDEAVAAITAAPSAPRNEWVDSDAQAYTDAILLHLASHMASSDKLDELHEQIQDMFDEFPDFPYEMLEESGGSALPYFEWLDTELAQRAVDEGGYELIQIDGSGSDEMDALVVYRRDTDDIIQAAALMGVTIVRPLTYYRGIEATVGKRPF
ncbi:hypothetical protein IGS59_25320 [Janthinobacterium sp. GW460P]|uniref:hypothetical protein n=1 Tax=unclassified Janthinobacterium TaxID=2610881 RepID=UPI000A32167E|nr:MULTISPECIES: hypothetical protein [unclassified Janthinobacterium]MCC7705568.1 hypothetical protein [Janthinobacterium sp. GW460P]MCC7710984.1 hypothetical protein [Janthinobacterium sp. GW460W]